jgi:tetratricopeptide (TPR) repeat protein
MDKCISYFLLALEVTKSINVGDEIEATRNLGEALLVAGNFSEALGYFQKSYTLSTANANVAGEALAKKALVSVHTALADKLEAGLNFEDAIPHHLKCLEYVADAVDDASPNEVYYRLGKAYQEIGT